MTLEKALQSDFGAVCALYRATVEVMQSAGLDQWTWGVYPSEDIVESLTSTTLTDPVETVPPFRSIELGAGIKEVAKINPANDTVIS